ncbi:DAO domain-containing protein [Mycena chlorophos]|uniref:DAO domain-containing protein n=1 Tax=Mycena chlorophos TaxID=658473 RepID=A0A8H6W7E9_MYCCL|nr:DAO domain-containing protein [Mycena chlorophos]
MTTETPANPGYPRPNPSLSFWLQGTRSSPLIGHRTTPTLPGPEDVQDVVIVGGGFSGVATAYFLLTGKNPPARVALLEAREVCDGATGRNGGHCRPAFARYKKYKAGFGKEQAVKVIANEFETMRLVWEIVKKEKIDCDFYPMSTYGALYLSLLHAVFTGKHSDIMETTSAATTYGEVYDELVADGGVVDGIETFRTPEAAQAETGIANAVAAYKWPAYTLWPYKLVAHLAQIALEKGLNLQTTTPVRSVTQPAGDAQASDCRWAVHTDRGVVKARKVVYATNAYTATLLPELGGPIYPLKGHAVALVPTKGYAGASNRVQQSYNSARSFHSHSLFIDGSGDYFMQRPKDGIFIVGDGRESVNNDDLLRTTDDGTVLPVAVNALKARVRDAFGEARWGKEALGEGLLVAWSGIMGKSADLVPYVGPLNDKPNAFVCAGHNGHGMARIMTCARGIAAMLQGATYAETGLPECFLPTKERLEKHAYAPPAEGGRCVCC